MPLFSRSLKPGSGESLPAATGDGEAEGGNARHTIGDLLRQTRQSYGGDIDRIATTLRIRAGYLTAIEESQYDKLPGPVYAQGFVRAYAVHLGLDGNEAIRRFKQEVAGFEVSRDLSFPVPLAERSIPGGTMVLAALILAICGYGLWYYVSTGDRAHPERVSAVPPDLVAATQPLASPPLGAPPSPAPAAAPSTATPAAPPPATSASTALSPTMVPTTATPPSLAATPAAPAPTPAATPAASASASPSAPSPSPSVSAPTSAPSPSASALPSTSSPSVSAPSAAQIAAAPATVPAGTGSTNPPPPRVFGAPPDVPTRIVVHAVKDSWIQLRNGDEVLIQRTLHPGDTVRIPDEPGLSLRTGNGVGIELEIDGQLGKPLSGTVRTVALDADRLTSGAARGR